MGFVHQYSVDPSTLGSYAFSGAAAKATRENLQRAAEMRQNAAQFNAQLGQHAIDRAVNQYDRQQGRAADIYQQQMQADSYALKNQYDLQKAQEANAADLQIEQMQQNAARANQFEKTKQEWLKQGIAKYSPQNKQQLADVQRRIAEVNLDPSIPPDHKEQMISALHGQMQSIIPQIVPEDERPVPLHERMAESTVVWGHDGQIVPGGTRPPQEGEWIGTQITRNGSQQTKWTQVPYKKDAGDNWDSQKFVAQQREVVRRGIMEQKNAEYDRSLRAWEARQKRYESAKESGYEAADPGDPPSPPSVQDWEVDGKLHEISGGLAGSAKPVQRPPSWPRPAMMGGYPAIPGSGAPFIARSEAEALSQPPGTTVILNGRKFLVGE